ncbi:ER lumen protein-retaining receptor 2 [Chanos chanos]|uniref:ER lumen protein-retaining receptor 2 n=1 Tax=Chanos chanos TaxID=29144 RepID=A0A6J2X0D8_CHACN|nr:ER lumen protein-retaining receptor 2-like [Chanos chanos]
MLVLRIEADVSHVLAIIILFVRFVSLKSCVGLSGKSQMLYALVFTTRYLDLFTSFISVYNTVMKVLLIFTSYLAAFLIYVVFRSSYDSRRDSFPLAFLLVPMALLSLLVNNRMDAVEICWQFSLWLESVAIVPQLCMIATGGRIDTMIVLYLFFLGSYRALYVVRWVLTYYYVGYVDSLLLSAGVLQTAVYCGFYLYCTGVLSRMLPERVKRLLTSRFSTLNLRPSRKDNSILAVLNPVKKNADISVYHIPYQSLGTSPCKASA